MAKFIKKVLICIAVISILCLGFNTLPDLYYEINTERLAVKKAISMEEALDKFDNKEYFIIKSGEEVPGSAFELGYGENENAWIILKGNNPQKYLSNNILLVPPLPNYFLVYGRQRKAKSPEETYSDYEDKEVFEYVIDVKSWDIIAPIKRDYTYSKHVRWFYPKKYLDIYDVKHKDYEP